MDIKCCSEQGCQLEVEFSCPCTSPETYLCQLHLEMHCKSNGSHAYSSFFIQPLEENKQVILELLKGEKSKMDEIKQALLVSFFQIICSLQNTLTELIKEIDSDSTKIDSYIKRVAQLQKLSKSEEDPILNLLSLNTHEALEKLKEILSVRSESYNSAQIFYGVGKEIDQIIARFNKKISDNSQDIIY